MSGQIHIFWRLFEICYTADYILSIYICIYIYTYVHIGNKENLNTSSSFQKTILAKK